MKIEYIAGDLLSSPESVIAHGCNAQGVMKSGVAKAIREKYPEAYSDYYHYWNVNHNERSILGHVIRTEYPDRTILNIISQEFYGRNPSVVYVSYDAIRIACDRINRLGYTRVAFPKIGAGLANGDWSVISAIIESYSNFTPVVYYIDPQAQA